MGRYMLLWSALGFLSLGGCGRTTTISKHMATPTPLMNGLYYLDYPSALKFTARLRPQKRTFGGYRWLRFAVPRPGPKRPKWLSMAWNQHPGRTAAEIYFKSYLFEYDWRGTSVHNNVTKQLELLGLRLYKVGGLLEGQGCPLRGVAFQHGPSRNSRMTVVQGRNIVAVGLIPRPCITRTFARFDREVNRAFARGDAALLREYLQLVETLGLLPKWREQKSKLQARVHLLEQLERGRVPKVSAVLAQWRRALAAGGGNREPYMRRLQMALLSRAKKGSRAEAVLLKDLSWRIGSGKFLSRANRATAASFSKEVSAKVHAELARVAKQASAPHTVKWAKRLDWYVDQLGHPGARVPPSLAIPAGLRLLEEIRSRSTNLASVMRLVRAKVQFRLGIQAVARQSGSSAKILLLQAKALQPLDFMRVSDTKVSDTVYLLRLWSKPPLTISQRVEQLGLHLFHPYTRHDDYGVRETLLAAAGRAEKRALFGTAVQYLHQAGRDKKRRFCFRNCKLTPRKRKLQRLALRLVNELLPGWHPKDPNFKKRVKPLRRHGFTLTLGTLFSRHLAKTIPLLFRTDLDDHSDWINRTVAPPYLRAEISPPLCNLRVRYFRGVRTKRVTHHKLVRRNTISKARSALERLNSAIARLQGRIASLKNVIVSRTKRSYVGGVVGSRKVYSPGGGSRTVYKWQGYRPVSVTHSRRNGRLIGNLSLRLHKLLRQRRELIRSFPKENQVVKQLAHHFVRVRTLEQEWSGPCQRSVSFTLEGNRAEILQSGNFRVRFSGRVLRQTRGRVKRTRNGMVQRFERVFDRGLVSRDGPKLMQQLIVPRIERRLTQLAKRHRWTERELSNERHWLYKWFTPKP